MGALAGRRVAHCGSDERLERFDVLLEFGEHVHCLDSLTGFDPGVEVGHQRYRRVTEFELAGQDGFRMTFTLTDRTRGGFSGAASMRVRLLPIGGPIGAVTMRSVLP